ncbi:MAG TPA: hypothetical protein VE572_02920, partial [Nitrososphaeraceae archaeon]|nr:hypothetical protein [Nitrososphaeraceae archaeon]
IVSYLVKDRYPGYSESHLKTGELIITETTTRIKELFADKSKDTVSQPQPMPESNPSKIGDPSNAERNKSSQVKLLIVKAPSEPEST